MSAPAVKPKRVFKTKPTGRPTVFTPEKQEDLLKSLSAGGLLIDWCKRHRMGTNIVFNFMHGDNGESFRSAFQRAREDCAHVWMDQTIKIADEKGTAKNPLDPQRQKLRVDTRMRIAGFLNRKAYGTRPEDAALNGKLTLGELVEAAVRHGAQLASSGAPATAMLDITPGATLAPMRDLAQAVMTPPAPEPMPSDAAMAQLNAPPTEHPRPRRRAAT